MAAGDIVFIHSEFADLPAALKQTIFDPLLLEKAGLIIKVLRGRGKTYFFKLREDGCVLRHYWRGGSIRRLSADKYIWIGLNQTRSYREWKMLELLETLKLPAPRRVGLRIRRTGLCYTSDIVTKEIKDSLSLADALKVEDLSADTWKLVGRTIRSFHDHNIFHQDLNASNILLTKRYCFLIDFDRGRVMNGDWWKERTLRRLKRSLEKFGSKEIHFHFNEGHWMTLLDGYEEMD